MNQVHVDSFTLHNDRGQSVLDSELSGWMAREGGFEIFGPVVRYSWNVDGIELEVPRPQHVSWHLLPDAAGFICFEKKWEPDNCILLDAYGKERMRLSVPWQLTKQPNPESSKPPTSFASIGHPCINPADGKSGQFGVTAWVEHAGKYYFELDYQTGKFLWGREIRD